jgi:hypothetical protein
MIAAGCYFVAADGSVLRGALAAVLFLCAALALGAAWGMRVWVGVGGTPA